MGVAVGTGQVESVKLQIETRLREHLLSVQFGFGDELVALLGRDGAGKTEILRSIAGVYTPEQGVINIQGRQVYNTALAINIPPSQRHAGWVPNLSALFPQQTVEENIAFPFRRGYPLPEHEAARRVDEILDLLNLSAERRRMLGELDVRRRHAVALGRALVLDPDVLLLDQPYKELEVSEQRKLRHDLQHLRRWIGLPTLFATSDLEEAYEIADRIALIDTGQLLQFAPPRTLVTRPANRAAAELVRAVNIFPGKVIERFSDGAAVETPIGTLEVRGIDADLGPVEVVIRPEHIRILAEEDEPPVDDNLLDGEFIDETDYGPLHSLIFQPDGARDADVLEISVNDLVFRQQNLNELGRRRIVLPCRAVHLMTPAHTNDDPGWLELDSNLHDNEAKLP